jgi:galactoside O-acetyltransferase
MAFLTESALRRIGFAELGKNVLISEKASIYNPSRIRIGDNSRIDDFCILSAGEGGIAIGSHVHIACYVSCIGAESIVIEDFVGLSGRVSVYSSTDDFSGAGLTNPTVPERYRNVRNGKVFIRKHAIVGAGAVIMPGLEIGEGAAIGALSFVAGDCKPFMMYMGTPARAIRERSRALLNLERDFLENQRPQTPDPGAL